MIYTRTMVRERLEEAADVHDRLMVASGPAGLRGYWPLVVRKASEAYGYNSVDAPKSPPHGAEIDRMDEALDWLVEPDDKDQALVWGRLQGAKWWRLAQRFSRSERQVQNWFGKALDTIAYRLNAAASGQSSRVAR